MEQPKYQYPINTVMIKFLLLWVAYYAVGHYLSPWVLIGWFFVLDLAMTVYTAYLVQSTMDRFLQLLAQNLKGEKSDEKAN